MSLIIPKSFLEKDFTEPKENKKEKFKPEEKNKLNFTEKWIFKPLQDFSTWLFGDPQSTTYETRRTFFEIIFASIGVILLTGTIRRVFGKDFI